MKLSREEYKKLYQKASPPSPSLRTVPSAFLVGGLICLLGQVLWGIYEKGGLERTDASCAVSCSLVVLGVLLTAFRIFPRIAKFGGAGALVPITGFANAIAAPAIEFKTEGFILGVGAKMFTIAGPVIVYGVSASVVYGFLYWLGLTWL